MAFDSHHHQHYHHLNNACHWWQMDYTTHAMHFNLEPPSSIDCQQLPRCCLRLVLGLRPYHFLLWVSILMLSCSLGVARCDDMSCPLSSHAPPVLYYFFHPCFRSYYLIPDLGLSSWCLITISPWFIAPLPASCPHVFLRVHVSAP